MSKTKTPAAKKAPGRPRVTPGADTAVMSIRFSKPQRDKISRNGGGGWVRQLVDKAKEPKP